MKKSLLIKSRLLAGGTALALAVFFAGCVSTKAPDEPLPVFTGNGIQVAPVKLMEINGKARSNWFHLTDGIESEIRELMEANRDNGYLEITYQVTEDQWKGNTGVLWGAVEWEYADWGNADNFWPKAGANKKWKVSFDEFLTKWPNFNQILYDAPMEYNNKFESIIFYAE